MTNFEQKLLQDIISDGMELHKPLISVWNNSRDIIRDKITRAFNSYKRCPNDMAVWELKQWANLEVDWDSKDAGNEPYEGYETTEWNGEAITNVEYE